MNENNEEKVSEVFVVVGRKISKCEKTEILDKRMSKTCMNR